MSIKNVTVAGGGILGGKIAFQGQFMGSYEYPNSEYQQESFLK